MAQRAYDPASWKRGTVKRAETFEDVYDVAKIWTWQPGVSIHRIKDAIVLGTPELSPPERAVLLALWAHVNADRLERGDAFVWPGAELMSLYLDMSESTIRRHRSALERKGYLLRDYNNANRPAYGEAFNLGPTVARLEEMERHEEACRAAMEEKRRSRDHSIVDLRNYRSQAPISNHLEQSPRNEVASVQGNDAPKARNQNTERRPTSGAPASPNAGPGQHPENRTDSAKGLPRKARFPAEPSLQGLVATETLQAELRMARQVVPAMSPVIPDQALEDPASVSQSAEMRAAFIELATQLLPEGERNNAETAGWAWSRHGVRAAAFLAAALGDTKVQSPCAMFGFFACKSATEPLTVAPNLQGILIARGVANANKPPAAAATFTTAAQLVKAPGHDAPELGDFHAILERILKGRGARTGEIGSYYVGLGYEGLDPDGTLRLLTTNSVRVDYIRRNYPGAILEAAQTAGLDAAKRVTLRSTSGGEATALPNGG